MAESELPPQLILAGTGTVALPEGVSVTDWALERQRWQNPRIRTLLGAIHMLEGVLDSNYAILHCSPDRLQEILRRVQQVADVVRTRLSPLFEQRSVVPELEEARKGTKIALDLMTRNLLTRLDSYPEPIPSHQLVEVRKLLCISMGQLHAFMQDTFGALMEADPRSTYDMDYYLSKRFPRDIEEAEWLYRSVLDLEAYLGELTQTVARVVLPRIERLESERRLLPDTAWKPVAAFLERLGNLTEKLREVLALRGVRFDEMEILDIYARKIPERCNRMQELLAAAGEVLDETGGDGVSGGAEGDPALDRVQAVFSRRLAAGARQLCDTLQDLTSFAPLWLLEISNRRALLLYQVAEEAAGETVGDEAHTNAADQGPSPTASRQRGAVTQHPAVHQAMHGRLHRG